MFVEDQSEGGKLGKQCNRRRKKRDFCYRKTTTEGRLSKAFGSVIIERFSAEVMEEVFNKFLGVRC